MKFGSYVPMCWRNMLPQFSVYIYADKTIGSFKMLVPIKLNSVTSHNTIILISYKICGHDSYNSYGHLRIILNYLVPNHISC
jgi:hypothetical protein